MNKAFYRKIVNLIPSADMKNYVISNGFQFREKDLLKIILEYAPTFDKRLELFEEASRLLSDKKMRLLAKKRIAFENRQYNAFMQSGPDFVYQIEIKSHRNLEIKSYINTIDTEDEYIVKTFDDAIILIKKYLIYYEVKGAERISTRFTITKFSTKTPDKPSDFSYEKLKVGDIGKCVLDDKLRIISLDMYYFEKEVTCKIGDVDCDECERCIQDGFTTHFPHFLNKYDLVAYYIDLINTPKRLTYGIFCLDMEECDYDSLVVTIEDNPYIQNRNGDFKDEDGYYRIHDAHDHPSCFKIIKPDLKNVPQEIIDGYNYAVPILKRIAEERNRA